MVVVDLAVEERFTGDLAYIVACRDGIGTFALAGYVGRGIAAAKSLHGAFIGIIITLGVYERRSITRDATHIAGSFYGTRIKAIAH